jgi:hypothetical protein
LYPKLRVGGFLDELVIHGEVMTKVTSFKKKKKCPDGLSQASVGMSLNIKKGHRQVRKQHTTLGVFLNIKQV